MDLNEMGTWIGVISGIASVTLAVVAIWFSVTIDQRSREVTDQTIKSLQKIETSVERLSSDTQNLIKAGWDRMIGNAMGDGIGTPANNSTDDVKAVTAGIEAELRSEVFSGGEAEKPSTLSQQEAFKTSISESLDNAFKELRQVIEDAKAPARRSNTVPNSMDKWIDVVDSLDTTTVELARALAMFGVHLERSQYAALRGNPKTHKSVEALRRSQILVPLAGASSRQPVYWFPPNAAKEIRAALALSDQRDTAARISILDALVEAGYLRRDETDYVLNEESIYPHLED